MQELEAELNGVAVSASKHTNSDQLPINYFIFGHFGVQPNIGTIERRMQQRNQKIQEIKQKMNSVEDHVYADFCKKIGVSNIRQFEERELVQQQERAKIIADFDQQIDRITSRLDFEKTKDTRSK